MKDQRSLAYWVSGLVIAVLLLAMLTVSMAGTSQAAPSMAPLPAPTPAAGTYTGGVLARYLAVFSGTMTETADGLGGNINVLYGDRVDLQYTIDQSAVNTATAVLQFSNDGTNWVDGPTVISANVADGTVMQQYNVFGQYMRFKMSTLGTTDPLTVSVSAVLR